MAKYSTIEENQKDCLEIAKCELSAAQSRMRDLDSKLNMLLVFLSALIVCIGTIVSMSYDKMSPAVLAFVIISIALMVGAVISILVGALPQKYFTIDSKCLNDRDKHNLDRNDFSIFYLDAYTYCLGKIKRVCKKKSIAVEIATCILSSAFIVLMATTLILLF